MSKMNGPIGPEDYIEPSCVLCGEPYGAEPKPVTVPQQRIIQKMDEYMSRRDYAGAERHLKYWLEEAKLGRDTRGQLMVLNELVGHYRKTADKEHALECAEEALSLLPVLGMEGSVSGGTTYVNCATAMNVFGENERALELFLKARAAYEAKEGTDPKLLGGLYNNMALACASLGKYGEAEKCYGKAMDLMRTVPGGGLERAITYLNLASLTEAEDKAAADTAQNGGGSGKNGTASDRTPDDGGTGAEGPAESGTEEVPLSAEAEKRINDLLGSALALFNETDAPRDGYYAFVCEKCAPSFSYYGWFLAAKELRRRAEELYAAGSM